MNHLDPKQLSFVIYLVLRMHQFQKNSLLNDKLKCKVPTFCSDMVQPDMTKYLETCVYQVNVLFLAIDPRPLSVSFKNSPLIVTPLNWSLTMSIYKYLAILGTLTVLILCTTVEGKINFVSPTKFYNLHTVFPRIVSKESILFWKLECSKYSREETIVVVFTF